MSSIVEIFWNLSDVWWRLLLDCNFGGLNGIGPLKVVNGTGGKKLTGLGMQLTSSDGASSSVHAYCFLESLWKLQVWSSKMQCSGSPDNPERAVVLGELMFLWCLRKDHPEMFLHWISLQKDIWAADAEISSQKMRQNKIQM